MTQRNPEDRTFAALLYPDILALLDEAPADLAVETEELHPADLADVAELLPRERVGELLAALPRPRAADVLEYLDDDLRTEVIEGMQPREAGALLSQMTPDDRADALEDLDEEQVENILSEIAPDARQETETLLAFDPDSAGGLMTTEFVSLPEGTSVEDALESVRTMARTGRKEALYAIYATDAAGRVNGVLSLRELLAAPPGGTIGDVAWTEVRSVSPSEERGEISRILSDYDLLALPVVSESGHMMGVITFDDVIDVIQEEQTEDAQKFGGMEAIDEPYLQTSVLQMVRKRGGWLCVLFAGSLLTATALDQFEDTLSRTLMVFLPLVISSGGNSGSQASSLIIRAMALGEVGLRDWWLVARRELVSGLLLGLILGALGLGRVLLGHHIGLGDPVREEVMVAAIIALTLVGIVIFGSLSGSMLPFILRRLGLDPASASAPFVATLVDVTGVVLYFGIAAAVLGATVLP